jgi:hypothetical protein
MISMLADFCGHGNSDGGGAMVMAAKDFQISAPFAILLRVWCKLKF